jgi:periplasmic protein TonB
LDTIINCQRLDGKGIIWAITASIFLHALTLVVVPNFDFSNEKKEVQILKIELQQPEPAASVAIEEPSPPVEVPEPPKPEPVKKEPKPIIKPTPIKQIMPPDPAPQAEDTPTPAVENIIAVAPTADRRSELTTPPPAVIDPPVGPSQADIDDARNAYGNLLGRAIAKHKSYPKIAERRGWEGTVLLDLKIDSNGNVLSAIVRNSSGYDALDKRALEMVERASPFPAPPKVLQGSTFNISVPVAFKLANG